MLMVLRGKKKCLGIKKEKKYVICVLFEFSYRKNLETPTNGKIW